MEAIETALPCVFLRRRAHKHPVALLNAGFAGCTHMLPHGQDDLFRNRQLLRGQVGRLLVMGDLRAGA